MNIMLTCAGRRTHVVQAFKDAVRGSGQVFACDASASAPALQVADAGFLVPDVLHKDYIDVLATLCEEHAVGLLVPSLEPELPKFALHRERFTAIGTNLLVSSPEVITTCYDKLETDRFLSSCGIATAQTFTTLDATEEALARGDITFPLVVKPRWGVSSICTIFPEDREELTLAYQLTKKQIFRTLLAPVCATDPERSILIQEQLHGIEYGLDIINDLQGRHVCTFTRRKYRMWAGQTDRAMTVKDENLEALGRVIGTRLRHVGILDCDVFVTDHGSYVLDMNPRLGGGYPFSHIAGANLPAALISWACGEIPDPRWMNVEPQLMVSRGDLFLVIDRPPIQGPTQLALSM